MQCFFPPGIVKLLSSGRPATVRTLTVGASMPAPCCCCSSGSADRKTCTTSVHSRRALRSSPIRSPEACKGHQGLMHQGCRGGA